MRQTRGIMHVTAADRHDWRIAALALTEAVTRLADRSDPIPDEVWVQAARHYDESALAGLVLAIAGINAWNRINATTRQITGAWVEEWISTRPSHAG